MDLRGRRLDADPGSSHLIEGTLRGSLGEGMLRGVWGDASPGPGLDGVRPPGPVGDVGAGS